MSLSHTYNPRKPFGILMRGRPDEPDSHEAIAVYSKEEWDTYRGKGWQRDKDFMERVDRARRKDA